MRCRCGSDYAWVQSVFTTGVLLVTAVLVGCQVLGFLLLIIEITISHDHSLGRTQEIAISTVI